MFVLDIIQFYFTASITNFAVYILHVHSYAAFGIINDDDDYDHGISLYGRWWTLTSYNSYLCCFRVVLCAICFFIMLLRSALHGNVYLLSVHFCL